jgi:hypothetical protein
MKSIKPLVYLLILIVFFLIPQNVMATDQPKNWTFGPWEAQEVIAWGSDRLIADFGSNGLWRYDGSWIKLSYLDPEGIIAWSDSKLVVNFGPRGLWKYDGQKWGQISLGIVKSDSVN